MKSINVISNNEIYVNLKAPLGVVIELRKLLKTGMLSNLHMIKWLDVEDERRLYRDGTTVMPINNTANLTSILSNTLNITNTTVIPITDEIHNNVLKNVNKSTIEESKKNTQKFEEEGKEEEETSKNIKIDKIINGDIGYSTKIISKELSKAISDLDDDLIRLEELYEQYAIGDNELMKDKIDIIVEKMGYNIGSELYQGVIKQINKSILTFSDVILLYIYIYIILFIIFIRIDYLIKNNENHFEWIEGKNKWNKLENKIIEKLKVTIRLCKPNDYSDKCLINEIPDILKTFDIDVTFDEIRKFVDRNCENRDILDINDVIKIYLYFSDNTDDLLKTTRSSTQNNLYKTKYRTLNNYSDKSKRSFEGGSGTLRYGRFKKNNNN